MLENRKILISVSVIILLLLIGGFIFFSWKNSSKPPIVPLLNTLEQKYYFDDKGAQFGLKEIATNKYSVVYFLSEDCKASMNQLEKMNEMANKSISPAITHIFLWQNAVPMQSESNNKIVNYSLKGKINVSPLLPYVNIVNDKHEIVFASGNMDYVQAKLNRIIESEEKK